MTLSVPVRTGSLAPSAGLAVLAMVAIQLAAGLSRPLVAEIGAPAVTWLRFVAAATVLLILTRPRLSRLNRKSLGAGLMLGAALAIMSVAYFAAVSRLPLGLASTIAFLGPLAVAILGAKGWKPLALALLAGIGVLLSLDPWSLGLQGGWTADPVGLAFAGAAACGFAFYVVLTRHVGALFSGTDGLTISLVTAALLLTPFGVSGMDHLPSASVVIGSAGLAILAPLLTCWMEMAALRKLGTQVFSILLSLEPAVAAALGIVLLLEVPNAVQALGILCVIIASVAVIRLPQAATAQE